MSGVCKRYGHTTILDGVDLTGANGAGKSTLMRIYAGVLAADSGTVFADKPIGYCPQEAGLFELLTADQHLVMFRCGAGIVLLLVARVLIAQRVFVCKHQPIGPNT